MIFFVGKAYRKKQSEGVVSYVELLLRNNAAYGKKRRATLYKFSVLQNEYHTPQNRTSPPRDLRTPCSGQALSRHIGLTA